jgi:two-component system chemotaxis response regulator CheB
VPEPRRGYRMVAVGASAGGLAALRTLLHGLPTDFELPVVVVQHRSRDSHLLCELLQECTALDVNEVNDKEEIRDGCIYVAPPDYHLLIDGGSFALSVDEPVRFSRPSIDVTFFSVASAYGPDAIGVVLTGANADGSLGLKRIRDAGGAAIVQDPAGAEVRVMPAAALKAVPDACVLTVDRIGPYLSAIRGRRLPRCGSGEAS